MSKIIWRQFRTGGGPGALDAVDIGDVEAFPTIITTETMYQGDTTVGITIVGDLEDAPPVGYKIRVSYDIQNWYTITAISETSISFTPGIVDAQVSSGATLVPSSDTWEIEHGDVGMVVGSEGSYFYEWDQLSQETHDGELVIKPNLLSQTKPTVIDSQGRWLARSHYLPPLEVSAIGIVKALYAGNTGYTFGVSGPNDGSGNPSTTTQANIDWFRDSCGVPLDNVVWYDSTEIVNSMTSSVTIDEIVLTSNELSIGAMTSTLLFDNITLALGGSAFVVDALDSSVTIATPTLIKAGGELPGIDALTSSVAMGGVVLTQSGGTFIVDAMDSSVTLETPTLATYLFPDDVFAAIAMDGDLTIDLAGGGLTVDPLASSVTMDGGLTIDLAGGGLTVAPLASSVTIDGDLTIDLAGGSLVVAAIASAVASENITITEQASSGWTETFEAATTGALPKTGDEFTWSKTGGTYQAFIETAAAYAGTKGLQIWSYRDPYSSSSGGANCGAITQGAGTLTLRAKCTSGSFSMLVRRAAATVDTLTLTTAYQEFVIDMPAYDNEVFSFYITAPSSSGTRTVYVDNLEFVAD